MAVIKCKMCGGDLNVEDGNTVCECEYCGTRQTVPSLDNDKKTKLFERANRLRFASEFDKAASVYESIIADFDQEAEAYWGLILCKFGIEYVDDPASGSKIPTCHRSSFDSVMDDPNFEMVMECADPVARRVYREEAKAIEELRKRIIEVSSKEEPYDVFISYKELDENGERTLDSVIAQDIYSDLTEKEYRVFFSRISLESKLGVEYEPYIFAALNSAKVMLVVGTDYDYFNAVWVKNEWSRFLALIASGQKKTLIPVFKDIDAYDMPKEFAKLAAQDMGKVGAMQDLIRGVEKLVGKKKVFVSSGTSQQVQQVVQQTVVQSGPNIEALLQRGNMALEDSEWEKAKDFFDSVLNMDAKCGEAYLGLAMGEAEKSKRDSFATAYTNVGSSLQKSKNVARARKFDPELEKWFSDLDEQARKNAEKERVAQKKRIEEERLAQEKATAERNKRIEDERINLKEKIVKAVNEVQRELGFDNADSPGSRLADAKSQVEDLEQICSSFESIIAQVNDYDIGLSKLKKQESQLEIKKNSYGFFANKEKKLVDIELAKVKERTAEISKARGQLLEKLGGFNDQMEAEKALLKARENVASLEEIVSEEGYTIDYLYSEAIDLLSEDERIYWGVLQKGPHMLKLVDRAGCLEDRIFFGHYPFHQNGKTESIEWVVLERRGNRILVTSKYGIDCRQYNFGPQNVTWETCSLREWLNTLFIDAAFSREEMNMIPSVQVSADGNRKYGTDPGTPTHDRVFLLSIVEAEKYFSVSIDRECVPTDYARAQKCYVNNDRGTCWWWLRSPGSNSENAANIATDSSINYYGRSVNDAIGAVRPAMWIDLEA